MRLADLQIDEFRDELAARCRKRSDATTTPVRDGLPTWITFHYSGVVYGDRRESLERARVVAEAQEHLRRNWGTMGRPVYADRYMYDFVVLSSGAILRTGGGHELWHCRNVIGNGRSWSVHVLLGTYQDLTAPQRERLYQLFDALRAECNIPRERVVGHCEWPLVRGVARPSAVYAPQPGQSSCPGRTLHAHLAAYRAMKDV